jgi:hypothetical protein
MAERKSTQKTDNGLTRIPLRIGIGMINIA